MKIEEITKIKQTGDQDEVNEFLAKGYKIIKIFSGKLPVNEQGDMIIQPVYVLGLKSQ